MRILGIESSCDETGLAILEWRADGSVELRAEVLSSQVSLHQKYGGVVPELASREHLRSLPLLCEEVFTLAGLSLQDIDAVGVTVGPGLKGCLLIGVTFAQGLCAASGAPLVPVNHIEGHVLSAELHFGEHGISRDGRKPLAPPYIALIVSGGHTEIVVVKGIGEYELLARTMDDAAGEAFDKSAFLLGYPYPGGAQLAKLADDGESSKRFRLPRVSREIEGFSFSGLKTAVALMVERNRQLLETDADAKREMAWAIQDAILDPLVVKTAREVHQRKLPLVVCGGVSANKELRRRLESLCADVYVPSMRHCVDNGAMIGYVAGRYLNSAAAPPRLGIRSRWPLESLRAHG